MMVRLLRYAAYLSLALIIVVISGIIVSQTAPFKNWLKNKIIAAVNESINGRLEVRTLGGNLFNRIQLEELVLKKEDVEILKIDHVLVELQPLSLLNRTVHLTRMRLESPKVQLTQLDSSSWSFQNLMKSDFETAATKAQSSQAPWVIEIPRLEINLGQLGIDRIAAEGRALTTISDLDLLATFEMDGEAIRTSIERLSFSSRAPDLAVNSLQTEINYDPNGLNVKNLYLETAKSNIKSRFHIDSAETGDLGLDLDGDPISLSELRHLIPELTLVGETQLKIEARGSLDRLQFKCQAVLAGSGFDLSGHLQLKEPFEYDITGICRNLNLATFSEAVHEKTDLNFTFQAKGSGFQWPEMKSELTVNFSESSAMGMRLQYSNLDCRISDDNVTFKIAASAEQTRVQTVGLIHATSSSKPSYSFDGQIKGLNLARFTKNTDHVTDLNFRFHAKGQGFSRETLGGELDLNISSSVVNSIPIDSAHVDLVLLEQVVDLHDFRVTSSLGQVVANGGLSMDGANLIHFQAELKDLAVLKPFFPADSLKGHASCTGTVRGTPDSLSFGADLDLNSILVNEIEAKQLLARIEGTHSDTTLTVLLEGDLHEATAAGFSNVNSHFKIGHSTTGVDFQVSASARELQSLELQGHLVRTSENTVVELNDAQVTFLDQKWRKLVGETKVTITDSRVDISELALNSRDQRLKLSGYFDQEHGNDLQLLVENFQISNYDSLLKLHGELEGRFDINLALSGQLDHPHLQGSLRIEQGKILEVPFQEFTGEFQIESSLASWQCILSRTAQDSLVESSGFIPIKLSLNPVEFQVLDDEPLEFKFNTRGFDLVLLQPFITSFSKIKGTLIADIVLTNTLRDLRGVGPIRLVGGEFDIRELGTRYRNINAAMLLQDSDLVIKDFRMRSENGSLELIEGGISLSEQSVKGFKTRFRVNNFPLMNNKKMRARVKGELELTGSVQSPYFSGNLLVTESRIFYPAWFEDEEIVELSSRPFFVIGNDSIQVDTTGAIRFQKSRTKTETTFTESDFYKNLRGELSLKFPRNSWIRSEDTNIEISGDLVTVKEEGSDLGLFGALSTLRGYYELLGNRFQITRGNLVFYGQAEPDPGVDIEAIYEFRDASGQNSEKHTFKVLITGSLSTPEFQFTLDGQPAAQQDVLSVLIFGQSFDNLAINQVSSVSQNTGLNDRATGFITGRLFKALSGELGKELSLDVIQIESGKNFEETRLRIGKYVTPDVFVSISQDFGTEGNRKVELEYEIPKKILFFNLLLQASRERLGETGVDVIWKIEW